FAARDAHESPIVKLLQGLSGRLGIAAPGIDDTLAAEVRLEVRRMYLSRRLHDVEHLLFEPAPARAGARVQQVPHTPRHESVCVQVVPFDVERRVVTLEIAGAVSVDPVPENQVLRARRRTNRIGLHEAETIDGALQCRRWEE